jgi:hypothetical protein
MKTSIEQILTKELVGRELLVYKYEFRGRYVYSSFKFVKLGNYLGSDYAKITGVSLSDQPNLTLIRLEETEFLGKSLIKVSHSCNLKLKEKRD